MLGFELDFWDYVTFITAALAGLAGILIYIFFAGLPGRIALARNHPEAEAVKLMGWAGLLPTVMPWVQALIWAFKPSDIVDIRRFPKEEAKALDEEERHLKGEPDAKPEHAKAADTPKLQRNALAPPPSSHDASD